MPTHSQFPEEEGTLGGYLEHDEVPMDASTDEQTREEPTPWVPFDRWLTPPLEPEAGATTPPPSGPPPGASPVPAPSPAGDSWRPSRVATIAVAIVAASFVFGML